jgi:hypothetical protein
MGPLVNLSQELYLSILILLLCLVSKTKVKCDITIVCRLSQAHARLMFREKVTVQDAVVAVSLVESSMQGSALIGSTDALHTSFPNNPMEEYRVQGKAAHQRD